MALASDRASLLVLEVGKEFKFYNDALITCGLIYAAKAALSLSWSTFKGIREHVCTKLYPKHDLTEVLGKWAVVCGASGDMGRAFAVELARRGFNIILVDVNIDQLKQFATELDEEFNISSQPVELLDEYLENPKKFQDFFDRTDIGLVVNTLPMQIMPKMSPLVTMDLMVIRGIITTNVVTSSVLIRMALSGMLYRNKGVILNVIGCSGLWPIPYLAAHSASHAYIDFFSRALSFECSNTNVQIKPVICGPAQLGKCGPKFDFLIPSTESFVRNTVDSVQVPNSITGSWITSLQIWGLNMLPCFAAQWTILQFLSAIRC